MDGTTNTVPIVPGVSTSFGTYANDLNTVEFRRVQISIDDRRAKSFTGQIATARFQLERLPATVAGAKLRVVAPAGYVWRADHKFAWKKKVSAASVAATADEYTRDDSGAVAGDFPGLGTLFAPVVSGVVAQQLQEVDLQWHKVHVSRVVSGVA